MLWTFQNRCPQEGWGYPSTGLTEQFSVCQANKEWSLTSVEDCIREMISVTFMLFCQIHDLIPFSIELPCVDQPPAAPAGGLRTYGMVETTYTCPAGFQFTTGLFLEKSTCTPAEVWFPSYLPMCESEFCKKCYYI